jgi:hypothetical protein
MFRDISYRPHQDVHLTCKTYVNMKSSYIMKNAICWNVTPYSLKEAYRHFGRTYCLICRVKAVCCSETSVNLYQSTRHQIPDDGILYSYWRENLKSNLISLDVVST